MQSNPRIISRLEEAARRTAGACVRILQADRGEPETLEGTLAACGPFGSFPAALRWEIRLQEGLVQPEFGEFLEAQVDLDGQELSFGTLVLAHERHGSVMKVWTTLPERLRVTERRRYHRVQAPGRLLISTVLATDTDPLRTLATDGGDFHHRGLLRNISEGGLKIIFPPDILSRMHVADQVSVSLRLPEEVEELTLDGTITYLRRRTNSQTISCGVDFADSPEAQRARRRIAVFVFSERRKRAVAAAGLRFW